MVQQFHSWVFIENKQAPKILIWNDTCIIYNSQDMEATQAPISRWMDKDVVHIYIDNSVYIYNRVLLSLH